MCVTRPLPYLETRCAPRPSISFSFFMIGFKLGDPCHFTNYLFRGDWLSVVRTKEKKVLERGEIIVRIAADKETADQRGDLVVTDQEP